MQAASGMHQQLEPAVIEDPELANYLQQVGDRIIASAKELDRQGYGPKSHKSSDNSWMFGDKMKFHFVNSKTLNAFTTGGEHMYIYTELFQTAQERGRAGGGDGARVRARLRAARRQGDEPPVRRDGRRRGARRARATSPAGTRRAGSTPRSARPRAMAGGQFVNMGFTRKDENEADELGLRLLHPRRLGPATSSTTSSSR